MDEKTIKRLEYEEQIFNFSSEFFTECFMNFVSQEFDSSIDALVNNFKKKLIHQCKNPDEFSKKVLEMKMQLKLEYKRGLDSEINNIKEQISKFMNIPEHVLLKEDLPVKGGCATDISDIERDVNFLKGKFKALNYLKKKMHDEVEMADYAIFILNNITEQTKIDFKILNTNEIVSLGKSNLSLVK